MFIKSYCKNQLLICIYIHTSVYYLFGGYTIIELNFHYNLHLCLQIYLKMIIYMIQKFRSYNDIIENNFNPIIGNKLLPFLQNKLEFIFVCDYISVITINSIFYSFLLFVGCNVSENHKFLQVMM